MLDAAAAAGARTVTVTTAGGTSGAQTFTINAPAPVAPTLTSVAPNQGIRGTTVAVTLTGTNFVVGATTVTVSGAGVTVNNVVVGSSTSLTASFVLDAAAAAGARTVTVTTAGGTSGAQTFTINVSVRFHDVQLYGQFADLYGARRRRQHHDSGHGRAGRYRVCGRSAARVAWAVGRRRPCPSRRARRSPCVSVASARLVRPGLRRPVVSTEAAEAPETSAAGGGGASSVRDGATPLVIVGGGGGGGAGGPTVGGGGGGAGGGLIANFGQSVAGGGGGGLGGRDTHGWHRGPQPGPR